MKKPPDEDPFPQAVVCYANYARFRAQQPHILNPAVKSRMCLWCKSGCGRVVINEQVFSCEHGDYFLLPWNHRVEYFADTANPFYLAGIHLIPDHDRRRPVEYVVPHTKDHPLYDCSWRQDRPLPDLEGVRQRRFAEDAPLRLLSESIVQLFLTGARDERQIRLLARSLVVELLRSFSSGESLRAPPAALRKALVHIDAHFVRSLTVEELARLAERSKTGITGMFRTHLGVSPVQWINRKRVDRARELLAAGDLSVWEIAVAVGIEDQFYFSRLFKKITGKSPLAYRKEMRHF